eukprot:184686_1
MSKKIELNLESKVDLVNIQTYINDKRIDILETAWIGGIGIQNNNSHSTPNQNNRNNKKKRKKRHDKKRKQKRRAREKDAYEEYLRGKAQDISHLTKALNSTAVGGLICLKYPIKKVYSVLEGLQSMGLIKCTTANMILERDYTFDVNGSNEVEFWVREPARFVYCGGPIPQLQGSDDNFVVSALNREANPKWIHIAKLYLDMCSDSDMDLRCDFVVTLHCYSDTLRRARHEMIRMFGPIHGNSNNNDTADAKDNDDVVQDAMAMDPFEDNDVVQDAMAMENNDAFEDNDVIQDGFDELPPNLDFLGRNPFALPEPRPSE